MDFPIKQTRQIPILTKKNGSTKSSGGLFSKDGRTKVNAAIEKYNKAALHSEPAKLALLRTIYLALEAWERRLQGEKSKKRDTLKLDQIQGLRTILDQEKRSLEQGSDTLSIVPLQLIEPDVHELRASYSAKKVLLIDDESGSHSAKTELPFQLDFRGVDLTGMDAWDQQSVPLLNLCKLLESKNLVLSNANDSVISIENAQGLLDFFITHPGLLDAFQRGNVLGGLLKEISLEDSRGDGGGVFDFNKRTVRINPGEAKKTSFMRIIVHELGHASLQRLLQVDDSGIKTQEGLALEEAFNVIKQNSNYFFGVDLGEYQKQEYGRNQGLASRARPRGPESRQKYQSDALKEFIAESFMHLALMPDELAAHVKSILDSHVIPQEVKTAWKVVIRIFKQYGQQILVFPKPWIDWADDL
ncbi:hypothetical protein [Spirosoma pulveris]